MFKRTTPKAKSGRKGTGLGIPQPPCIPPRPKHPPPPRPADSGCSTGTGWKQYKDLLRGKR